MSGEDLPVSVSQSRIGGSSDVVDDEDKILIVRPSGEEQEQITGLDEQIRDDVQQQNRDLTRPASESWDAGHSGSDYGKRVMSIICKIIIVTIDQMRC